MELANYLYGAGEYALASAAYERLIKSYPSDREIAGFQLILGLIAAKHLNDPVRAKGLIGQAKAGALDEQHRALAESLLADLG